MATVIKVDLPAYRKNANGEWFVKIVSEQQYVCVQITERLNKDLVYRYEKTVTPRGIPSAFFETYTESNEKEFLGAVQKYLDYSDTIKTHLNSKK